jgi:FkbM family methyltransferase
MDSSMKIFIDCGTHLFQGFKQFAEKYNIDSEWKCYCFEANPFTYERSKQTYDELVQAGYNITHLNNAVYNSSGTIKVNCSKDDGGPYADGHFSQGSNILLDPPEYDSTYHCGFTYQEEEVLVDTIDFSKFLSENVASDDFVVVKMDIEGAEFEVLPSLIQNETYKLINDFYCEFHERFFEPKSRYKKLKEEYKEVLKESGILVEEWF